MNYLFAVFAFAVGLAVALFSTGIISRSAQKIKPGTTAASGVTLNFLISQVLSVGVLFIFRSSFQTLLAAALGLMIPKNVSMIRQFIAKRTAEFGGPAK
jgi:hypothetical protein